MQIIYLFLFTFLLSPELFASESRLNRCAKLLAVLREEHAVPSQSVELTRESMEFFRGFRATHLNRFDYSPGSAPVVGSANSPRGKKQKVAHRLSALLQEANPAVGVDEQTGEAVKQITLASTIAGRDEIHQFLEQRRAVSRNWQKNPLNPVVIFGIMPFMSNAIILTWAFTLDFPQTAWLTLLLTGHIRHFPESTVRLLRGAYAYDGNPEDVLLKKLDRLQPNGWYYRSADQKVPIRVAKRIRFTGEVSNLTMREFLDDVEYPRLTYRLTSDRFISQPPAQPTPEGWIRMDELLSWDARLNQPVLVTAVRIAEVIPRYPKPVVERKPLLGSILQPSPTN